MRVRGSSYACRSGDNFAKSLIFLKIFDRVAREFICVECRWFSTAYLHSYPQAAGVRMRVVGGRRGSSYAYAGKSSGSSYASFDGAFG